MSLQPKLFDPGKCFQPCLIFVTCIQILYAQILYNVKNGPSTNTPAYFIGATGDYIRLKIILLSMDELILLGITSLY
jgi:hypothetical protein